MKTVLMTALMLLAPVAFAEGTKILPTTPAVIEQGTPQPATDTIIRCAKFGVDPVTKKKKCVAKGIFAKKTKAAVVAPTAKAPVVTATPATH